MIEDRPEYLIPIKGYSNLFRDDTTGMIVSINSYASSHYKRLREKKLQEKQEINELKSDVRDIKSLLNKLLEKING